MHIFVFRDYRCFEYIFVLGFIDVGGLQWNKKPLQSKLQNLNAKFNQMWTTDGQKDRETDRQTSSIHKPELLCNQAKTCNGKHFWIEIFYNNISTTLNFIEQLLFYGSEYT